MARPFKQGVDYFPLNVHMDNKVKFVEIKFGLEGFAVIVKILQHVYDNGYWVEWGEDDQLLFCSDIKIDFEKYEMIFSECMKREIFSRFMYEEHGILTSTGIQKRYKEMVRRRKDVNIVTEYLLIEDIITVNVVINSDSEDIINTRSKHDDGKSTQRKEKEKEKVKEKIKDIKHNTFSVYTSNTDLLEALNSFSEMRNKLKKPMTDRAKSMLLTKLDKMASTDEDKISIIEKSVFHDWTDVYELKEIKTDGYTNGPKQYAAYKPEMPKLPPLMSDEDFRREQKQKMDVM